MEELLFGSSGDEGCEDMPPLAAAWPADTSEPRLVMPSFTHGGYSSWRQSGLAETIAFQSRLAETVVEVTADMTEPEASLAWNLYLPSELSVDVYFARVGDYDRDRRGAAFPDADWHRHAASGHGRFRTIEH